MIDRSAARFAQHCERAARMARIGKRGGQIEPYFQFVGPTVECLPQPGGPGLHAMRVAQKLAAETQGFRMRRLKRKRAVHCRDRLDMFATLITQPRDIDPQPSVFGRESVRAVECRPRSRQIALRHFQSPQQTETDRRAFGREFARAEPLARCGEVLFEQGGLTHHHGEVPAVLAAIQCPIEIDARRRTVALRQFGTRGLDRGRCILALATSAQCGQGECQGKSRKEITR